MGFDISGLKAKSTKGEYFRNNVWWWRRLWEFVCVIGKDVLSEKDMKKGHWNNGEKITAAKTEKLVELLEKSLQDGTAKSYAVMVQGAIRVAKKNNKGKTVGDKDYDWSDSYPFTLTNLKEFIAFLKDSGGFIIC